MARHEQAPVLLQKLPEFDKPYYANKHEFITYHYETNTDVLLMTPQTQTEIKKLLSHYLLNVLADYVFDMAFWLLRKGSLLDVEHVSAGLNMFKPVGFGWDVCMIVGLDETSIQIFPVDRFCHYSYLYPEYVKSPILLNLRRDFHRIAPYRSRIMIIPIDAKARDEYDSIYV